MRARTGLGLAEVVVALAVLAVATTGIVGATLWAARLIRAAEASARALTQAESVLDSLARVPQPGDGTREQEAIRLVWTVHSGPGGPVIVLKAWPAVDSLGHTVALAVVGGHGPR